MAREKLAKVWLSDRDLEDLGLGSAKTRQNLRAAGKEFLPFYRFGRAVRYKAIDVANYLKASRTEQQAEQQAE